MQADAEAVRLEGGVLAELYVSHAPEALRLAYLLTGDCGAAEDLVQDAFV
ncbi:MAG: sigma factor [Actinomycetota bacterium]